MPRLMNDLKWRETSGVDRAANLAEGWLMMKSATPETAQLLSEAFLLAKGIDPSTAPGRTPAMPFDPSSLPEEAQTYIAGLEKSLVDAGKSAPVAPVAQPTEADIIAKAMEALPEGVREIMAKSQRDSAEAVAKANTLLAERELSGFVAKAATLTHVPGVSAADFGATIQKATHGDAEAVAVLVKALEASNSALKEGLLFKEIGSSAPAEDSAHGQLEALAKSFEAADPKLTHAEAIAKAASENPELYTRHRREADRRNKGLED